jgi:hypothetical protein
MACSRFILIRITIIIGFVFLLVACSSAGHLNENTGKDLLQQRLLTSSYSNIANRWFGQETTVDLSDYQVAQSQLYGTEIKHLIDSQFVTVSTSTVSYSLAQDWTGKIDGPFMDNSSIRLHLILNPDSGAIGGTSIIHQPQSQNCQADVQGKLSSNGQLSIDVAKCLSVVSPLELHLVSGSTLTHIHQQFDSRVVNWTVTMDGANIQTIRMRSFRYSWSPRIRQFTSGNYGAYRIGKVNVEDVTDLILAGAETQAKATFRWSLAPNDLGRALEGTRLLQSAHSAVRSGTVEFAKKPDNTWVATQFLL